MALGPPPRPHRHGPALGRFRLPLGPLALSAVAHLTLILGMVVGAAAWRTSQPKAYVVNLVPAVAALGAPQSGPAPDLPPRIAPRAENPPSTELPAPDIPGRLPDRALPSLPGVPRPGEKELPQVATAARPRPPAPTPPARREPRPSAPPLGSPIGTLQGAGTVTLNVSDFPFAWYIQAIHRKIQDRWEGRAIEGRQPEIIFEIERNGQLRRVTGGKKSGNTACHHRAPRASSETKPFPPLPDGIAKTKLTRAPPFTSDTR